MKENIEVHVVSGPTGPAFISAHWEYKMVSVQPGVKDDLEYLNDVLKALWEPYACTWDGSMFDHHLRRFIK